MKKHLARNLIIFIIWCLLIAGLLVTYFNFKTTKAFQISSPNSVIALNLNKTTYNEGDEVIATIKTNENASTISFYLNYNSDSLSLKSADEGISFKDYPEQKLVRAIYYDLENKGRDTFTFNFKATKSVKDDSEIYLTNAAISTVSDKSYQQNNDEIKVGIKKDNELSKTKSIIMISLAIAFAIITVILIISLIKSNDSTKGGKKDVKESNN